MLQSREKEAVEDIWFLCFWGKALLSPGQRDKKKEQTKTF